MGWNDDTVWISASTKFRRITQVLRLSGFLESEGSTFISTLSYQVLHSNSITMKYTVLHLFVKVTQINRTPYNVLLQTGLARNPNNPFYHSLKLRLYTLIIAFDWLLPTANVFFTPIFLLTLTIRQQLSLQILIFSHPFIHTFAHILTSNFVSYQFSYNIQHVF